MSIQRPLILFDGLSPSELDKLTWEEVEILICRDDPVIFKASNADILAQFGHQDQALTVQISVVEGGGDGVLFELLQTTERLARIHGMRRIIWQIHALNCKEPNPKLQRVLKNYNFQEIIPDNAIGYFEKTTSINDSVLRRERPN